MTCLKIKDQTWVYFYKRKNNTSIITYYLFLYFVEHMLKKMNKCISMQIKRFFKEKLIQHSDAAFAKITKTHQLRQ